MIKIKIMTQRGTINYKSFDNITCQQYGTSAVKQQQQNINLKCGFDGDKWNSSSSYHSKWCKQGNQGLTGRETSIRDNKLEQCKQKKSPQSGSCVTSKCWGERKFTNNRIKYQYYMKDGVEVRDGQFFSYSTKDGKIKTKGTYKHGCKVGTWISYYMASGNKPFKDLEVYENCKRKSYTRVKGD